MKNSSFFSWLFLLYGFLQKMFDPAIEGNPYDSYHAVLPQKQTKTTQRNWLIKRWAIR